MMRTSTGQLTVIAVILLLTFTVFSGDSEGQQEGEKIERGQYFLGRAPSPEYSVAKVNLDVLSRARFPEMKKITEGPVGESGRVQTLFDKRSGKQIRIAVTVYDSVSLAEDAALDLLNSISAILKPGSEPADVIGTHSWYMKSANGSGTIVFVYNNSVFQLSSPDYNFADINARAIVADLKEGRNGITLGRRPQIQGEGYKDKLR